MLHEVYLPLVMRNHQWSGRGELRLTSRGSSKVDPHG